MLRRQNFQKKAMPTQQSAPSAKFNFSDGREILGNGLNISIGTVKNNGSQIIDLNESACYQQGVVGISFWPSSTLAPQQVAEVFIAKETLRLKKGSTNLPSLLKGL